MCVEENVYVDVLISVCVYWVMFMRVLCVFLSTQNEFVLIKVCCWVCVECWCKCVMSVVVFVFECVFIKAYMFIKHSSTLTCKWVSWCVYDVWFLNTHSLIKHTMLNTLCFMTCVSTHNMFMCILWVCECDRFMCVNECVFMCIKECVCVYKCCVWVCVWLLTCFTYQQTCV